jgi:enamine deaminase RidA (YjgF/YER057c/UK114 family)
MKTSSAPASPLSYSQAVVVGGFVFVSGQGRLIFATVMIISYWAAKAVGSSRNIAR